ncbi:MAG: YceD family protein [Candidatus Limnocylindria bacterium]
MTAFNVAGLLHEPPGSTRELTLRDHYVSLGPDVELAGPIDADLQLQRTNRGVLLRGEVRAPLRRTCARCTDPFVEEVRARIVEEFLPSIDPESGSPLPSDEDDVFRISAHHEVELDPVLHDELALTEPMHPLCRPDCPGLCPECGLRLDERHAAHAQVVDPRLAGLAALLRDAEGPQDR